MATATAAQYAAAKVAAEQIFNVDVLSVTPGMFRAQEQGFEASHVDAWVKKIVDAALAAS